MSIRAVFLFTLTLLTCIASASTINSMIVKDEIGKTSVIFTLTGPLAYKAFTLPNPQRVVIDFDQTKSVVDLKKVLLKDSMIARVRSGQLNPHTIRIVFEMKQTVSIRASASKPLIVKKNRLQIDILPRITVGVAKVGARKYQQGPVEIRQATADKLVVSKSPIHVQHGPSKKLRDVVIVIDPGHGGKDPGAIGPERIAEKNVVLSIALNLKQKINKIPGMRAVLTRNGDYYVGLRERLNIARRYNADVFISIHADAFINQHSSGVSVFALSPTGATSEAARWLAEKENYSELGGVNLSGLDDQSGVIRTVLLDLSQTATISAGLQMGSRVLHHMDKVASLHNSAVEQARFVVLKSPDIPSILIETGFITNPREERNLSSPLYQARLTQAIFDGLKGYFMDYPPHGTRLEAVSGANLHIVRSGESLPSIAASYHTSVAAIKSANHLSDGRLRAGQRLSIPPLLA